MYFLTHWKCELAGSYQLKLVANTFKQFHYQNSWCLICKLRTTVVICWWPKQLQGCFLCSTLVATTCSKHSFTGWGINIVSLVTSGCYEISQLLLQVYFIYLLTIKMNLCPQSCWNSFIKLPPESKNKGCEVKHLWKSLLSDIHQAWFYI